MAAAEIDAFLIAESITECGVMSALMIAPGEILQYAELRDWHPIINSDAVSFWNAIPRQEVMRSDLNRQIQLVFDASVKTGFDWLKRFPKENASLAGRNGIDACRALKAARNGFMYVQEHGLLEEIFRNVPEVWDA